ncbi:MAG TPA: nucleotidyltransferase domain-containing protein [Pyrinomonadaceae bacterium]
MTEEFIETLPPNVGRVLTGFVEQARSAFADDLRAVVLYGSGAEGQLRPTSDVNLLLVLSAFEQSQADQLREPLRLAQAVIRLRAMFLLESELRPAMEAFAVKFADITRRRRVLYGDDPFTGITVSRTDAIVRLKQTLLNLTLRSREAYIARGLREEQLVAMIADMAGPLRSCAATLLELEGRPVASPKEALHQVAASMPDAAMRTEEVSRISEARQERKLAPGVAAQTLFHLIELSRSMWARANALS